ncbi:MAG: ATP-binding protein [Lachnospiraceae bacterium]|nr:ATP-binding protein [Lachnospiraceae bacterium]
MKKRIFKSMVLLASIVLVISTCGSLLIYYQFMTRQIESQIAQEGMCIAGAVNIIADEDNVLAYMRTYDTEKPMRLTLIQSDGSVVYDNFGDTAVMENHLARPEVIDAIEKGTGHCARFSDTIGKRNYYYAVRLDNGNILRLSYTTNSILLLGISVLPLFAVCFIICLVVGFIMADRMTRNIIKPINNIDLQHPKKNFVYKELRPLLIRINRQNDERNKNEKMRQEFSANVSHELKTPLTSISGYAELLKDGIAAKEDVPKFAEKIYKEAGRMINLVNDIIKISKLDEHRIGIEKESVDLLKVALDVAERLEMVAENNRVKVNVGGYPVTVPAVSQMIDELIYNLCENAIKYNRPGGRVDVSITEANNKARIEVSDTGIGIPDQYKDRVFERFFRVDKSHSRQTGGTGLGLAIVKHIVEYHHGEIQLSSKLSEGTKIVVLLNTV